MKAIRQSKILRQQQTGAATVDTNIHAREYRFYLPSKAARRRNPLEWTREQETAHDK